MIWKWIIGSVVFLVVFILFVVYRNLIDSGEISSNDSFISKLKAIGDKCCLGKKYW